MVKIIHCADLHLDSPFSSFGFQTAKLKRELLRGTFTSLMLYARMEKADIMLLPGDIFDTDYVSRDTVNLLVKQFEQIPECRFVISPGNHDPFKESSPYKHERFPSNVHIFSSPMMSKFSFDDIGVDVYGFAFTSEAMETCPVKDRVELDAERINILSCHADMSSGSKYCPLTEKDIAASGFDYVALGHIHKSEGVNKAGQTYYAYSGCPEGRGWDETGEKSVIMLKAEKNNGVFDPAFTRKVITRRRYECEAIDATGVTDNGDAAELISNFIHEKRYDSDTSVRIILRGEVKMDTILSPSVIADSIKGVSHIEIKDETAPLLDIAELKNDPTVRGAFYSQLEPMLESDNEEEKRLACEALRLGLQVLGKM